MCPVPPLTRLEYIYLFPFTGPGGNRSPARFLGLDDRRTVGELRSSIENTLRLYRAIQAAGVISNQWLQTYRAEVSQIAQGDVSMPRSFMEMELSLIRLGVPFTLTGLGVPAFLPRGVEVTWADVADALAQIMTGDELIEMASDLDAAGATELSNEINNVIAGGGGVTPAPVVDDDIPPGDDGVPSNGNGVDLPDDEPIISGDALSLLLGGGIIATALALS